MSDYLRLTLLGVDGAEWCLTEQHRTGVELRPGPQQLIDAPAATYWIRSIYGMSFQGGTWKQRQPVFSVNVAARTPDRWEDLDSAFRLSLGVVPLGQQFSLRAETGKATRTLAMQMLKEPDAYKQGDWEGKDPHLYCVSTLGIQAACERPFWVGTANVYQAVFPSGNGTVPIPVANFGDVPVWLNYKLPAPGTWTVADYSWGQEAQFGRAPGVDATRTQTLQPLTTGSDLDLNMDPDQKLMVAANAMPVEQQNGGVQFMYPLAPLLGQTTVPLELVGGNPGTTAWVICPAWFSRPWGVSV